MGRKEEFEPYLRDDDIIEHMKNVIMSMYMELMGPGYGYAERLRDQAEVIEIAERIVQTDPKRSHYIIPHDWRKIWQRRIGEEITLRNKQHYGDRFLEYFNEDGTFRDRSEIGKDD